MPTAIASASGLLAIWSRQTVAAGHPGPGAGLVVAWIAVLALTYQWARIVWSRTIVQLAAEQERRRIVGDHTLTLVDEINERAAA